MNGTRERASGRDGPRTALEVVDAGVTVRDLE